MSDLDKPLQYEAEVPATLDLAEMAELTIRGITNRIDPDQSMPINRARGPSCRPPTIASTKVITASTPILAGTSGLWSNPTSSFAGTDMAERTSNGATHRIWASICFWFVTST